MTELRVVGKRAHVVRSKRVKLAAVLAAEAAGVVAAERQTGIPEATIRYWLNDPQFTEIRAKARADLAEEYKVAAHLTVSRMVELIPTMEARDVIAAAEKSVTIMQLLSGQATNRTETRDITDTMTPDAVDALADEIDAWLLARKA